MRRAKNKRGRPPGKVRQLPKGFKPISGLGGSWNFRSNPQIIGRILGFRTVDSAYKDDRGKPKKQKVCDLQTENGQQSVWESAGTRALFGLKKGAKVCIIFRGLIKIKGRKQPMKDFQVGVA